MTTNPNVYRSYLDGYIRVRSGSALSDPAVLEEKLGYALGVARGYTERLPEAKAEVERQVESLLNNDVAPVVSGAV